MELMDDTFVMIVNAERWGRQCINTVTSKCAGEEDEIYEKSEPGTRPETIEREPKRLSRSCVMCFCCRKL